MNTQANTQSPFPAAPPPAEPVRKPSRVRRVLYASALLIGGGVIGAVVAGPVVGQGWHGDPPWQRGGYGMDHRGGGFGPMRFERGMDRALWWVDASPEQRDKLRRVFERASDDLIDLRAKHVAARRDIITTLGAATIDRAKLETLRGDQMKLAETASKRVTEAVADAAEVLTPTQRGDLARWAERWHRWRHG